MPSPPAFLDAHVHHWDPVNTPRAVSPIARLLGFHQGLANRVAGWLFPQPAVDFYGSPEHLLRPYLPADYRRDIDGSVVLAAWVHVEAGWQGKGPQGPVAETRWLEGLEDPGIGALVANADLMLGADVDEVLAAHRVASPRVRAIRDLLAWHPHASVYDTTPHAHRSRSEAFRAGFDRLAEHGLAFETVCFSQQLGELVDLARSRPSQQIVLCHAGTPVGGLGSFAGVGGSPEERAQILAGWRDGMAALADCPNVVVKISGLGMPALGHGFERRAEGPWVEEVVATFAPLVDFVIERFGADRCMFGSNFPIDKASLPLSTLLQAFERLVAHRPVVDQERLFAGTARATYGL